MRDNTDSVGARLEDADAVIQSLNLTAALSRASTAPSDVSALNQSRVSSTFSPELGTVSDHLTSHQLSSSLNIDSAQQQSTPKHAPVSLEVVHVNQINIPPKERVSYTKSTQTTAPAATPSTQNHHHSNQNGDQQLQTGESGLELQADGILPQQKSYYCLTYSDEEDQASGNFDRVLTYSEGDDDDHVDKSSGAPSDVLIDLRELNEDERKQIELREDYQQFINKATKILERALYYNESSEIFVQYFPDGSKGNGLDSDKRNGNKLSLNQIFYDERWSKDRCVNGFDWSTQYPELLLASYHTNERAPSDPDGTLLVWNMKFKNTSPEYKFHCQSPIMSCCFAKFHPSLIIGGTYSGQIVLWDMRSNKKTPIQRSPLTAAAHTHPVYCAKVVGTQNAHNLISISTDGKLCSWSLDMLSAPQDTMELNQQKQARSVAVTCMSFHPDDYNNFLVGSEEGTVYSACRHGSKDKQGILSSFDSHQGFVTNVDYRPIDTQGGYSHLFLTSSIDWTVKLWDSKESQPIHSFESNGDYVYDVKWSPTNPALFATVDGGGRLDVWNLANDMELPTASVQVEPMPSSASQPSLNKLLWTPNGNQIVVGDDVGGIHVYDVGDVGEIENSRRQEDKWKLNDQISRLKM